MSQNSFFGTVNVLPGAATAVAPATSSPPVTKDWQRWVAENLLRGTSPEAMIEAMTGNGFDRATCVREIEAARSHPYVQAAAKVPAGAATATGPSISKLAKREWLIELYRRSALQDPETSSVPLVRRPFRKQFLHEFYGTNRPVVIEKAMNDWPAMTQWTMENLKRRFGNKNVEVQMGRTSDANYEMNSNKHKKEMPFGQYVDVVVSSGRTNDFYMTANNSGKNSEALADAWKDIKLFPEYLREDPSNRGFFWFGPAGIITPLHHDLTNNFMAQVVGRKLVRLIAPYDTPYMYNHHHCYSQVDLNNVDHERFPLFKNVRVIDVVLNPGQVLFLPIGWWHHVTGMDISITMTFTNFVFDNDFHSWYTTYGDI